jgi:hypothetical protein
MLLPGGYAMMIALRFLAGVFLLVAVIALVHDATRALAAHAFVSTSLFEHWSKLAPASLAGAQSAVQRYTHPLLWDPVIRKLLLLPTWALFTALGALLAYAGRRRRRVNVFAN